METLVVYVIALAIWLFGWACHALWIEGMLRERQQERERAAFLAGRRAEWKHLVGKFGAGILLAVALTGTAHAGFLPEPRRCQPCVTHRDCLGGSLQCIGGICRQVCWNTGACCGDCRVTGNEQCEPALQAGCTLRCRWRR